MIIKATELLDSTSYLNIALGLMLVTGRRSTEIIKTARFHYSHQIEQSIGDCDLPLKQKNNFNEVSNLLYQLNLDDSKVLLFSGQFDTKFESILLPKCSSWRRGLAVNSEALAEQIKRLESTLD